MKKVYKIRHTVSGLFYKPGRYNLSEKGKIYDRTPCIKGWISPLISLSKTSKLWKKYKDVLEPLQIKPTPGTYYSDYTLQHEWISVAKPEDWEIITYELEFSLKEC